MKNGIDLIMMKKTLLASDMYSGAGRFKGARRYDIGGIEN